MRLLSDPGCPPSSALAAIADGRLPAETRDAVTAHVADCDRCLDEIAAIVRLGRAPAVHLPASLRDRVSRPRRTAWRTAAAVAATLFVAAGGWWMSTVPGQLDGRGSSISDDDAVRSLAGGSGTPLLTHPEPNGHLSAAAVTFTWQPVASALTYRLRVMRDDGQLVWEGETAATTLRVNAATRLPAAVPLYVAVTAVLPDGRTARAPSVPFTIVQE